MRNEETMCEGLLSVVIPVYNIRDYVERCVHIARAAAHAYDQKRSDGGKTRCGMKKRCARACSRS